MSEVVKQTDLDDSEKQSEDSEQKVMIACRFFEILSVAVLNLKASMALYEAKKVIVAKKMIVRVMLKSLRFGSQIRKMESEES